MTLVELSLVALGLAGVVWLLLPHLRDPARRDPSVWRGLAVVGSVAAAGVHAAVVLPHLEEAVPVGLFFAGVALGQAAWACALALDASDDRLLVLGIAGNLGLIGLWVWSRTVGIAWFGLGREPVGAWDLAAAAWELVVVGACLVGLRRAKQERAHALGDPGPGVWAWALASGAALVVLTLTATHAHH